MKCCRGQTRALHLTRLLGGRGRRGGHILSDGSWGPLDCFLCFHACVHISVGSGVEIYYHIDEEVKTGLEITNNKV